MKPYLLGIDIGTSACKVAVFEKSGTVVAAANGDYPVYYPKEGWAEQNPEEWWSSVCQAVKKAIQKAGIAPEEIAGIGIDGQSWSAIAMDKDGNVLTNTPIWMDTRAQSICDRLNEEIGAEQILKYPVIPFSRPTQLQRSSGIKKISRRCTKGSTRSCSLTATLHIS